MLREPSQAKLEILKEFLVTLTIISEICQSTRTKPNNPKTYTILGEPGTIPQFC